MKDIGEISAQKVISHDSQTNVLAKNFILSLLQADPSKRPTAKVLSAK
jgi:hypothetical protein